MSINIVKELANDTVAPRQAYCDALIEMAKEDARVVVLDADLIGALGVKPFQKAFPERTFDCGIMEANMIGTAAGLSATGFIPFAHSFGTFASRRCYDQVFMSCAYARQNVKIVGSDPGIYAATNGGTHMPFEDVALMRTLPGATVVEPVDSLAVRELVRMAKDTYGVWYLRFPRKNCVKIYEEGTTFTYGKANRLRDGKDVTLIAAGYCVAEALKAADILSAEGISARVLDMFCIKPLDGEAVLAAAKETGAIVTAENHNVVNGLGSAVADALAAGYPAPLEKIGAQDVFGEVGPTPWLAKRFGMTAEDIVGAAKKAIARK
ncbi:MAG: transketolase family protein [Lachnospiraceae bacterium]|nr:transketolase family protein [Lachnospiraceae bacterium]